MSIIFEEVHMELPSWLSFKDQVGKVCLLKKAGLHELGLIGLAKR